MLITSYVIFGFTTGLFNPFRSLYIRELGASPFLLGLMSSLGSVIMAIKRSYHARGLLRDGLSHRIYVAVTRHEVRSVEEFERLATQEDVVEG